MKPSFKDLLPGYENNAVLFIPLSFLFLRNNFNKTSHNFQSSQYQVLIFTDDSKFCSSWTEWTPRKGNAFSGAAVPLTDKNERVRLGSSIWKPNAGIRTVNTDPFIWRER